MYLIRWLNRKYPVSNDRIFCEFYHKDNIHIEKIKKENYKVGTLTGDFSVSDQKYPKGSLVMYKRIKSYEDDGMGWDGGFDYVGFFKCSQNLTPSGYHSFKSSYLPVEELKQ
jgi:hypothetical protein